MCLILFSLDDHPEYKLIIAANRDEFYSRKTAPAGFWPDRPDILGGRDLEAQGTWMAMTTGGKIAMITNYRDPAHIRPTAPSRGKLVSDYLVSPGNASHYLASIEPRAGEFNGFNLIVGNSDELFYFSNYSQGIKKIQRGLHGISNHLLETPWPKVQRGKEKMKALLGRPRIDPSSLLDVLFDNELAADNLLPDTGVGLERERSLSPMFIKTAGYGTRCSTAVLIDRANHVVYCEREYDLTTFSFKARTFELDL